VKALNRLLSEPIPASGFSVLDAMKRSVGPLVANKYNNAIQHSTVALTSLRSGVGDPPRANVIPSVAEATIDCRVLPGTTKEQWLTEIARKLGDPSIRIEITWESPDPVVTPQDTTFYKALEAALKKRYPDAIVTPMIVPYGTDANKFRPRGVKSYGFTPAILPAAAVLSMHGDAEFVPADALGPAIEILYDALVQTAAKR
jgi:acetylornithine deacetylase/succinyl-diaminopimelate desuccinylase-like protein